MAIHKYFRNLYGSLMRLDFGFYLDSPAFKIMITELGHEDEWEDRLITNVGSLTDYWPNISDHRSALVKEFIEIATYELKQNGTYGCTEKFLIPILKDFAQESESPKNFNLLINCFENLDFKGTKVDLLIKELDKIQKEPKRVEIITETFIPKNLSNEKSALREEGSPTLPVSINIFLVHGHDKTVLLELKQILKEEFHLNPIVLGEIPIDNLKTIIEKLDSSARTCNVAIILMTPDDKVGEEKRARENVILELGYFLGLFPPNNRKILILRKGAANIPSDISGVERIDFTDTIESIHLRLQKQLKHWKLI